MLKAAVKAFVDQRLDRKAEAILEKTLEEPGTHSLVGYLWVKRCAAREFWKLDRRLEALRKSSPALGRRATFAFFQSLGEARRSIRILKAIKRHRPALKSDTQCWGAAGCCLLRIERHHAAAEWMSDWADRPDVEGWMLKNLVQALRATGNDYEASRVSHFAVALPRSTTTAFHQLWLILDDLLAGPCEGASDRIARLDRASLARADEQFLLELASCLAAVRESTSGTHSEAIASATRAISALGRRLCQISASFLHGSCDCFLRITGRSP